MTNGKAWRYWKERCGLKLFIFLALELLCMVKQETAMLAAFIKPTVLYFIHAAFWGQETGEGKIELYRLLPVSIGHLRRVYLLSAAVSLAGSALIESIWLSESFFSAFLLIQIVLGILLTSLLFSADKSQSGLICSVFIGILLMYCLDSEKLFSNGELSLAALFVLAGYLWSIFIKKGAPISVSGTLSALARTDSNPEKGASSSLDERILCGIAIGSMTFITSMTNILYSASLLLVTLLGRQFARQLCYGGSVLRLLPLADMKKRSDFLARIIWDSALLGAVVIVMMSLQEQVSFLSKIINEAALTPVFISVTLINSAVFSYAAMLRIASAKDSLFLNGLIILLAMFVPLLLRMLPSSVFLVISALIFLLSLKLASA